MAHELGTTQASITFGPDRAFAVTVTTDAQALLEKLETMVERPLIPPGATALELEARLNELADTIATRMRLAFDGDAIQPQVRVAVVAPRDSSSPQTARIAFRGARPGGATTFTWQYGWTYTSYPLSLRLSPDAEPLVEWLDGSDVSRPLPAVAGDPVPNRYRTMVRYLWLGFTHIVPLGTDHVLFVLGLFLLNSRVRPLLMQVSAFTLAHSITLGLTMHGVVSLPSSVVEPLIALSIGYVAVENLWRSELSPSRLVLVFACGLLHGLGFAGVLTELGLPAGEFVTALASFNVGVEIAQIAILAAAFALVGIHARRGWYRDRVAIPASLAIACVAFYWTVERMSG